MTSLERRHCSRAKRTASSSEKRRSDPRQTEPKPNRRPTGRLSHLPQALTTSLGRHRCSRAKETTRRLEQERHDLRTWSRRRADPGRSKESHTTLASSATCCSAHATRTSLASRPSDRVGKTSSARPRSAQERATRMSLARCQSRCMKTPTLARRRILGRTTRGPLTSRRQPLRTPGTRPCALRRARRQPQQPTTGASAMQSKTTSRNPSIWRNLWKKRTRRSTCERTVGA